MALKPVDVIMPVQTEGGSKGRKGGGKFGQMAGAAVGGVIGGLAAGAASGGAATAAGATAGAAAGAGLGGMLGEAIKPTRSGSDAISRRLDAPGAQLIHSEQSEKLKQSLMALQQAPQEAKDQYAHPLFAAYMTSLANDNRRA